MPRFGSAKLIGRRSVNTARAAAHAGAFFAMHYVVNSYDFMIFHKINGQKARFETGKSASLTEWVIPWPNGVSLTGDFAFGPLVSNKFQNGMGVGACLIFKTGPDPVLKRSFCHLLANGLIAGASLFE
jgi:hypothetical protein